MNTIEERVYTLTDNANSLAAELYDALEMIRRAGFKSVWRLGEGSELFEEDTLS